MISNLLHANERLLVPVTLIVVAGAAVRGVFALYRSTGQARKEFLDVWGRDHPDDLWVEVAIRHLFGTYLPAAVIRMLRAGPQAGRALLEVSDSWPLLEMDDETGDIRWRYKWHATRRIRRLLRVGYWLVYFIVTGLSLLIAYVLVISPQHVPAPYWAYPIVGIMVGLTCLHKEDQLQTANRAVPRWLGLP